MAHIVVTGGQWGDEGKGKVIDILSSDFDVVVRYQGGNNAGHTVVIEGRKYFLHLVPSGIFHEEKQCIIGNGVVVDPIDLKEETDRLRKGGLVITPDNLTISDRAHLVMPYHKTMDGVSETRMGSRKIGTTCKGIGPAYASKIMRNGIRAGDLRNPDKLARKITDNVDYCNYLLKGYYATETLSADEIIEAVMAVRGELLPYLGNTAYLLEQYRREGRNILFEGAQASLLDIDHGTYPFVTSSSIVSGSVGAGAGFSPVHLTGIIGVFKAYLTRVGSGPFPTEQPNGIGDALRQSGHEYGTTTGRPRRCGWFDLVAARYARIINGYSSLALTKMDVLSSFDEIPICTGYRYKGDILNEFPADVDVLEEIQPVYKFLPGWKVPIAGIDRFDMLPEEAQQYVRFLEENMECGIFLVSTGPDRNQTIVRDDIIG